jgi:hypothetical protein
LKSLTLRCRRKSHQLLALFEIVRLEPRYRLAGRQRLQQIAPMNRDEHHLHLDVLLLQLLVLGQLLVQIRLEQAEDVVGRAALDPFVHEIEGLAVDRQHANDPP